MIEQDRSELVLVTGGSGFIGGAVVERLAQHYRVAVLDRPGMLASPAAETIGVDLRSDSSVHAALQRVRTGYGTRIASVIHLAAYFDLEGEPHPDYERVTVRGTERLLQELQSFELQQFVFASTLLVHAPGPHGAPIDEDWPQTATLPYPASKLATERLIRARHGELPVVLLRPAGVYDDGGHAAFLAHQIARIYERRLQGRLYPGDADAGQPFLHLDDLCDALLRIVERRRALPGELVLLLGEPETPSFAQLQERIGCLVHGEQWETLEIPPGVARLGATLEEKVFDEDPFIKPWMVDISSDHYEIDISRAVRNLGWRPRHRLLATLPAMIDGLKADPPGWYRSNKLNPAVVADRAPAVAGEAVSPRERQEREAHRRHMRAMHFEMLWTHGLNVLLGLWLLSSPFAFGAFEPQSFGDAVRQVSVERGLADPLQRMAWLGWSEIASGALIVLFGVLSFAPRLRWAQWANAAVGLWLLFAPLVFWSPSAAIYHNDTLVGTLVITFALLVPMMPGMSDAGMRDASNLPPGWNYSPSTYLQRLPLIVMAFVGYVIARQLTAYQLGHVDGLWEPFFAGTGGRNGSETIVTSEVSKAWPVADAGLGAIGYLVEVLMGAMGDSRRWRTMPWMVAAFGVVVVPLGVISIYFIVIQPIVIGTWCTLCLIAAAAMLVMVPYTLDELVATGQFLVQSRRRGEPFWRSFLQGGASPGSGRSTDPGFDAPLRTLLAESLGGVSLPWTLVASAVLGIGLMFTRLAFGTEAPMADSDHLVGALVVTVAVSALAEVARPLRFLNVLFGIWLIVAPWWLDGAAPMAAAVSVAAGVALIALSLPRGERSGDHYGSWDRWVL